MSQIFPGKGNQSLGIPESQYFTPGTNSLASGFKVLLLWEKKKKKLGIGVLRVGICGIPEFPGGMRGRIPEGLGFRGVLGWDLGFFMG